MMSRTRHEGATALRTACARFFLLAVILFFWYHPAQAQTNHYRSIGTNAGILYNVGNASISAGTNVVTFAGGASLPVSTVEGAIGTGDKLVIGGETLFILLRDSAIQVTVQQNAASTHTTAAYTITRAYTTLQAWEDDCASVPGCLPTSGGGRGGDLVTDDRFEFGVAYNDAGSGAFIDNDVDGRVVRIRSSTVDATRHRYLTVAVGQRHDGIAGTGAVVDGQTTTAFPIQVSENFTRVEWFEVKNGYDVGDGGSSSLYVADGDNNVTNVELEYMLVYDYALNFNTGARHNSGGAGSGDSFTVRNSIFYNGQFGVRSTQSGDSVTVENCTTYNMGREGYQAANGGVISVTNSIAMGTGTGSDFTAGVTGDYNLDEDGSAPGASSLHGRVIANQFVSVTPGSEDLHLKAGADAIDAADPTPLSFCCDIDGGGRKEPWDIGADDFAVTTEVELVSFAAAGLDAAVELTWETGSELDNLGFHLYRALTLEGPYEQITSRPIPGLGNSPVGANYRHVDSELTNGLTYYYKLEDIETTGATKLHGARSATPGPSANSASGTATSSPNNTASLITYGNPSANSLRVLKRSRRQLVLELTTNGFYAEPQEDGSVRLEVPGFDALAGLAGARVPVKRTWLEAVAGRKVKLVSVQSGKVEAFTSLRPSDAEISEVVATPEGTVRAARRRARKAFRKGKDLSPSSAARIVSVGFQGDVKKALVELAPLRWDESSGQLLLARRLVVRLSFHEREPTERVLQGGARGRKHRGRRSHDRRSVVARLRTTERGLHRVRYEEVMRGRHGVRANGLRLSRQGETVSYHLVPDGKRFKPGSVLYFVSEGAQGNPYGNEAVYELEVGGSGRAMATVSAAPSGEPQPSYWHRAEWEQDRYYQAALVDAPDLWLWDFLWAPETKSYPVEVSALVPGASQLSVWLQGASDFPSDPDHRVRVYVNGSMVEERSWDGKQAQRLDIELAPGLLREGDNVLEIENVGDTEAEYSMVMLDRYAVEYPRLAHTSEGRLDGRWNASGAAELSGLVAGAHVLDVSDAEPSWLVGQVLGADGLMRFHAEAGRSYLAVSPQAVLHPSVIKPRASQLKSTRNHADYVVIGPETFLHAATPLVRLRQSQGLKVKAVAIEEIYAEFGFGESTPEAVKDFLSFAYHRWKRPPRYILLMGDATFDFKDHLKTGVVNRVPPRMVKTSYLWTASDPSYAAVNGDDLLPDLAIGRLPAATVDELQVMVKKIIAYETGDAGVHGSAVVLVADNPDQAGNFEADARALATGVLATRHPHSIFSSELGTTATRNAILQSFDNGASLVSYMGHGGIHLWADENFFNASDVASLQPQSQQPLLLTMNCLNGFFHFPYFDSLAEALVQAEDKGAIAAFSPTGLSLNTPANLYHHAILEQLLQPSHRRLGDAILAAQQQYAETGAFPELLAIYHLLGDPALTLK